MQIASFPEAATPEHLRRQVVALQDQAWPPGDTDGRARGLTHDPDLNPITVVLLDGERVLAALDILSKPLNHAGTTFASSGLSTVVVDETQRGRGYGHALVTAAGALMRDSGADLALFTCDRPLVPFYEAAGFAALHGTVLVGGTPADPLASDAPGFDKVSLAAFYSARAIAHRNDFRGARVALYPGPVDRLW